MKSWKLILLIVISVTLAACADDSNVDPEAEENGNEGEEVSDGGDLNVATSGDVVSLDPHGSNDIPSELLRNIIFDGLVGFSADGEIINQLATGYEQVDDYTWQFELRDDVTFHDGSEFNAEVVEANMYRIIDPLVASERAFLLEMIEDVEIVDDYTVNIVTEYPYAPLIMNLAHGAGNIISKNQIDEDYENAITEAGIDMTLEEYYEARDSGEDLQEEAGEISSHLGSIVESNPIGSGYMQFDSRSPGESTALVKFEEFYEEPAKLDSITFNVIPETGARIAEIETGNADVINGIGTENLERVDNTDGVTLEAVESNLVEYIGINTQNEPMDDPLVRQALSYALDRESVIEGIFNGSGRKAQGILPPSMLGYDEDLEGYEYDMERAEELLDEAGYSDGFDISIAVNDESDERIDMAIYLQEALSELNINLDIQQMEWGAFLEATGNGEYDMFTYSWNNSTADPDNAIVPLLHSDYVGIDGNRSFMENDELDEMLNNGRREADEETRGQIYSEAQEFINEQSPMIFVRYGENFTAYNDNVTGVVLTQNGLYDFVNTTIDE
ncbi:glutathione ABC transporter substrate-binding protein [Salinicoccus sp. Marseille-QA3877]